jgi:hypothetical protein
VPETIGANTSDEAAPEGALFESLFCCWFHYIFNFVFIS